MLRRVASGLLLLACLLAVPAAAVAGDDGPPYADSVTVLGPEPGDPGRPPTPEEVETGSFEPAPRLVAAFDGRAMCLMVTEEPEPLDGGACDGPGPEIAGDPWVTDDLLVGPPFPGEAPGRRPDTVGGATSPDVAAVEYVMSGNRTVRVATVPAPPVLAGTPGAGLRWFLADLPGPPVTRRLLDAAGALLEEELLADRPPVLDGATVLRRRAGALRWSLRVTAHRLLSPVRGDVGRRVPGVCLELRQREANGTERGGGTCAPLDDAEWLHEVSAGCGPRGRTLIYGVSVTGAVPTRGILGDGRRVRVDQARLPASFGRSARAWLLAVPPRTALRSLVLAGRPIAMGLQPSQLNQCALYGSSLVEYVGTGPTLGGDAAVAVPGGPSLSVRDHEDRLCVAIGRPTREGDCLTPRPGIGEFVPAGGSDGARAGAAVDARVTAAQVTLTDGRRLTVPTVRSAAYAGRFAGEVAFVSVAAPAGTEIASLTPLDLRGRPVTWGLDVAGGPTGPAVTLLDRPVRVTAQRLVSVRGVPESSCVRVFGESCEHGLTVSVGSVTGTVDCGRRRAVLLTGASRRTAQVTMRLADGTSRRLPIRRLPAGERAAIAVPPAHVGVRELVLRSRAGRVLRTIEASVPPAARQCGYEIDVFDAPGA